MGREYNTNLMQFLESFLSRDSQEIYIVWQLALFMGVADLCAPSLCYTLSTGVITLT